MTDDERAEWNYRYAERLAILVEDRTPSEEALEIAYQEANQWLMEHRKEQGE